MTEKIKCRTRLLAMTMADNCAQAIKGGFEDNAG